MEEAKDLTEWVCSVLVEQFSVERENAVPTAHLREDLGLESLDLVDLLLEFERFVGRRIENDDVSQVKTVGDVVTLLEELRRAG